MTTKTRLLSEILQEEAEVITTSAAEAVITGICCDSRAVKPGDLFAAFKGTKADGDAFIADAIAKGATAILCDEDAVLPEQAAFLPVVKTKFPRKVFSHAVARFFEYRQPEHMVAVTGTNGKTSVAHFCRQIWQFVGHKGASIGTVGAVDSEGQSYGDAALTTPDTVGLHAMLGEMQEQGVTYAAMEASSHGLDQYRLDGVRIEAAGFTSFSRDHLDYHLTQEAYFSAKARLFAELLPEGGTAVLNADIPEYDALFKIAGVRKQHIISYGERAEDIRLIEAAPAGGRQEITIEVAGKQYLVDSPLVGRFQAYNLLCALGLVAASGVDMEAAVNVLHKVQAVTGRMECVAETPMGARIFVDYAHTPDGLEKALQELRAYANGKLVVVFGCGGDRDKGKRPVMGRIAAENADEVIVTDDNPRTENAAIIRQEIMAACQGATEIAGREEAIRHAVGMLQQGDILLIAGKGHEDYQIIGTTKHHFDDREIARNLAKAGVV